MEEDKEEEDEEEDEEEEEEDVRYGGQTSDEAGGRGSSFLRSAW